MARAISAELPQDLLQRAAELHVRAQADDATAADWEALTAWLEADDRHREAYDLVETAEQVSLQAGGRVNSRADEPLPDNVISLTLPSRLPRRSVWWTAAGALAASILVGLFLWARPLGLTDIDRYATATGEQRTIVLADGSTLVLNTGTEVDVAFSKGERHVALKRGEAFFDVAKDPSRPFTVAVADQQVRVVGTAYNILNHDGVVTVSVERGIVDVRPLAAPNATPQRLRAGDRLRHEAGSRTVALSKFAVGTGAAWREGRLVFKDARLSEVVSEMNRYFAMPVKLGDAEAGDMVFTGVLQIDRPELMIGRLAGFLPIVVQTTPEGFILSRQ